MRCVSVENIDFIRATELQPYELQTKKISLSDLVNIIINSELTEQEQFVIKQRYYNDKKLSVINRENNIQNVYKVHSKAIEKLYTFLKYVVLFNVGSVGRFDESIFNLVTVIAEKERNDL